MGGKPAKRAVPGRRWWRRLRYLALGGLWIAAPALVFASAVGFWAELPYRLEVLTHFPLPCLMASACGVAGAAWLRSRGLLAIFAVTLAVNGSRLLDLASGASPPSESPVYTAVAFNMYSKNETPEAVIQLVQQSDADIFLLLEVFRGTIDHDALRSAYPYVQDAHGKLFFSRFPLTNRPLDPFPGFGNRAFEVQTPEGPLVVVAVHTDSPGDEKQYQWRNRALEDLAKFARQQEKPVLLLGDFNCSEWSPVFRRLLTQSGLHLPRVGMFATITWPAQYPWLWTRLDYFLLSEELRAHEEKRLGWYGSDHAAIELRFSFSEPETTGKSEEAASRLP